MCKSASIPCNVENDAISGFRRLPNSTIPDLRVIINDKEYILNMTIRECLSERFPPGQTLNIAEQDKFLKYSAEYLAFHPSGYYFCWCF